MHVPPAERAARWRTQAQADRDTAERLETATPHIACFLSQQASEKALKALLTRLQGDAVPTHHAYVLLHALTELGERPPDAVAHAANALDRFYLPTRYPDALDFADVSAVFRAEDACQAVAWADTVLRWCDERMAAAPPDPA